MSNLEFGIAGIDSNPLVARLRFPTIYSMITFFVDEVHSHLETSRLAHEYVEVRLRPHPPLKEVKCDTSRYKALTAS